MSKNVFTTPCDDPAMWNAALELNAAVLAEREACAKIAKDKAGHMQMMLDELMQLPPPARISHTFLAYQARLMDCLSIERDIRARSTENGGET